MKRILPFLALISLFSCRSIVVSSQYDRSTPIDQYFSFNWLPGLFEDNTSLHLDQRTLRMIQNQSLKEMILKGFAYAKEQPEVLLNIETITNEKRDLDNIKKLGYNYWGGYDSTRTLKPGDLVIELVDAASETVFWQGVAQNAVNIKKEEEVGRMLKEVFGRLGY